MGKWLGVLLAIMIACAVVGFLVDALRAVAGLAFMVCLGVIVWQIATRKPSGPA